MGYKNLLRIFAGSNNKRLDHFDELSHNRKPASHYKQAAIVCSVHYSSVHLAFFVPVAIHCIFSLLQVRIAILQSIGVNIGEDNKTAVSSW